MLPGRVCCALSSVASRYTSRLAQPGEPALPTEVLGYLAATGTTIAFLPQVIRVWKTRSAEDISLSMYLLFVAGVALWIAYGLAIHSVPVVAANCVTLVLAGAVLVGKFRFGGR